MGCFGLDGKDDVRFSGNGDGGKRGPAAGID
jgi:hypothetical protein